MTCEVLAFAQLLQTHADVTVIFNGCELVPAWKSACLLFSPLTAPLRCQGLWQQKLYEGTFISLHIVLGLAGVEVFFLAAYVVLVWICDQTSVDNALVF